MDKRAIAEMYRAEHRHFWFYGTRRIVISALTRRLDTSPAHARLIDLGCGTGYTIACGAHLGNWTGVDIAPSALEFARRRLPNAQWVESSVESLPFEKDSFHAGVCLDVLEHLPDERPALNELCRVLDPHGIAIVAVPGWPSLFGSHDRALGHQRRYSRRQLRQVLHETGFDILLLSSYNLFLAPAIFSFRLLHNRWGKEGETDVGRTPARLDRPLGTILSAERFFVDKLPLRGGISLMAIVRPTSETATPLPWR